MAENALKERALDLTANLASVVASRKLEVALSTFPEVMNFSHTGKR